MSRAVFHGERDAHRRGGHAAADARHRARRHDGHDRRHTEAHRAAGAQARRPQQGDGQLHVRVRAEAGHQEVSG